MRNPIITVITTMALVTSQWAVPVMAQSGSYAGPTSWGGQNQGYVGTIRCESKGNRQQRCNVSTGGRVELVRVIGGRCSQGRDWGYDTNGIWVSGGCRAEFRYGYADNGSYPGGGNYVDTLRCESKSNRYKSCKANTGNRVELTRVIAGNCLQGRDWGYDSNQIWVANNCRADFGYGYAGYPGYPGGGTYPGGDYAGSLVCESRNRNYQQCAVRTDGRVALVRRISGTCNEGNQWGYDSDRIWVTNNCRAEFAYGYANYNQHPGPEPEKDKGPSAALIIGGLVIAGGLAALLAGKKNKDGAAGTTYPARGPATLSANLNSLPTEARPSVQKCMTEGARQIGATGGTRLAYNRLIALEQDGTGWRFRATMTATYPDEARSVEMNCRATASEVTSLDFK